MTTPTLTPPKFISLKNHPALNEKWLEEQLIANPSLLGLGDLAVLKNQIHQPSGGYLDLLLHDMATNTRYEVEIQLGRLDESHIIRTIEYWDIERRLFPQYDHIAVIVAEDVTSRFLNVISLFNGTIPLIAIQLKGVEVNEALTLIATRVVDAITLGTEEEDAGESVNRAYWEQKASKDSLLVVDRAIELINTVHGGMSPNYNKHYIGPVSGGVAQNFVTFSPNKSIAWASFKLPQEAELTAWLDETGLSTGAYNSTFGNYRVRIRQSDLDEHRDELVELIARARDAYFS